MAADSSTATVALRPWPAAAEDETSFDHVFNQVHRLALQRGHLRGVTEQALQEEVANGQDFNSEIMEGVEEASGEQDAKPAQTREERRVEVVEARMEMHKKLELAKFAAANSLDLVSLLLTKDATRKTPDGAFSHLFKQQNIPSGSFGIDRITEAAKKPQDEEREEQTATMQLLTTKGARMKVLDDSVDDLLRAATQLETEVRKETKYWDELLSITQNGWSVQKMQRRNQRQTPFLVRFGHPEASGQFKARGAAPLRMAKEGGIVLDPALRLTPKTLRIRINAGEKTVGSSSLPAYGDSDDLGIEKAIRFAQDSLFEEELCHEIILESRQLLSYNITVRDSVVHISMPTSNPGTPERTILIDCVEREVELARNNSLPQDSLAKNIAEGLRLLLAHEHRMRLYRRSRLPPPLTQGKRSQPNPPLLRPLLAFIYHIQAVDSLKDYLDNMVQVLTSAGLNVALDYSRETTWEALVKHLQESPDSDLLPADQLLEAFIKPLDGLATLSLPSALGSATEKLTIATKTTIGPPTFGVGYKVSLPPSLVSIFNLSEDQPRDVRFTTVLEMMSYLDWVISLDLTHTLLSKEYPKSSLLKYNEPRITIVKWEKKKRIDNDVSVKFTDGALVVTAMASYSVNSVPSAERFEWDGRADKVTFREKVNSFVAETRQTTS